MFTSNQFDVYFPGKGYLSFCRTYGGSQRLATSGRVRWLFAPGSQRCKRCAGLAEAKPAATVPAAIFERGLARVVQRLLDSEPYRSERARCHEAARALQARMRKGTQVRADFEDELALWGYVAAKFASRARLAFRVCEIAGIAARRAIASIGGGPGNDLFGAMAYQDLITPAGGVSIMV